MSGFDDVSDLFVTSALATMSCGWLVMVMPFIVLDFCFANGDSECLVQEILEFSIPFHLKLWLRIKAITMLISCLALVPGIIAGFCSEETGIACGIGGACYLCLNSLFSIAWLVVGAIMFWGDLYHAGTCDKDLTIYMFVNLIYGFFLRACCQFTLKKDGTTVQFTG